MSLPARVATLVVAFLAVVSGVAFVTLHIIGAQPPVENYAPYAENGSVNVTLETTAQSTSGNKPDWVSYWIQNPQTHQFEHTTSFQVPANTTVNVTILGYDGCTPLRNPLWGQVAGVTGNAEQVTYFNGKTYSAPKSISTFDSWADCSVQHTFAIPGLGINVPIASVTTLNENQNLCGTSPCTANNASEAQAPHTVVKFSFKTPATTGTYRWQCFIPCGLGYVDGNGGPMGNVGYMMGEMEVSA